MATAIQPRDILAMMAGRVEIDFSRALEILQAVEAAPDLYLTTGSACASYEVIRDWVEGGRSYE